MIMKWRQKRRGFGHTPAFWRILGFKVLRREQVTIGNETLDQYEMVLSIDCR